MAIRSERFTWRKDMLCIGGTIVGSISEGASGDWFAYGCMNDWEDTRLGAFKNKSDAKDAVKSWAEEHL